MMEIRNPPSLQILDFLAVLENLKCKIFFDGQTWWPTIFHKPQSPQNFSHFHGPVYVLETKINF